MWEKVAMKATAVGAVAGLALVGSCTRPLKDVGDTRFVEARSPILKYVLEATGAGAINLGGTVIVKDASFMEYTKLVDHERVHSRQQHRYGLTFWPRFVAASAAAVLRGKDGYYNNELECQAFEWEDGQAGVGEENRKHYPLTVDCDPTEKM